jgi:uncharacterized protein YndB with AHSA1/START domain
MITKKQTEIQQDLANKKLLVSRDFDAPVDVVWRAWTEKEFIDQWWAPKPWKARTKTMDFKEGGTWLYCMEGPDGEQQWCRADFTTIVHQKYYEGSDAFSDEHGNINNDIPVTDWKVAFSPTATGTKVNVELKFKSEADLQKIVEMGFKEGFTAAHENLDTLLEKGLH